jgi:hypothetical protein
MRQQEQQQQGAMRPTQACPSCNRAMRFAGFEDIGAAEQVV